MFKTESRCTLPSLMDHYEIARIMTERGHEMTRSAVWQTEQRALRKIRKELAGTDFDPQVVE